MIFINREKLRRNAWALFFFTPDTCSIMKNYKEGLYHERLKQSIYQGKLKTY